MKPELCQSAHNFSSCQGVIRTKLNRSRWLQVRWKFLTVVSRSFWQVPLPTAIIVTVFLAGTRRGCSARKLCGCCRMPSEKRQQLIDTALALFQKHGYHATGIDTILEEAGFRLRKSRPFFLGSVMLIIAEKK